MALILNKYTKLIILLIIIFVITGIFLWVILKSASQPNDAWPEERVTYGIDEIYGPLEFVWSRSNLFVLPKWSFHPPAMAAAQGNVLLSGMADKFEGQIEILALNGQDGALIWHNSEFSPDAGLLATADALYIGENGYGTIASLDLDTGQVFWSRRIPSARSIRLLEIIDNVIYVISSAGIHFLEADTGEILKSFTEKPPTQTLHETLEQLVLTSTMQIKPEYFEDAVFTPSDLVIKDGNVFDRKTKKQIWQVEGGILSNVVTTPSSVYLLTNDRQLLVLKPQTGKLIASVKFEPQSNSVNSNAFSQSFYVAVDENARMVFVFLGDGTQLFAFELQ